MSAITGGKGEIILNPGKIQILALLVLLAFSAACGKEPAYVPGSSVQGYRAPISKILFSPIAFDGATVAIEGFVTGVREDTESPTREIVTYFRLSDLNGNTINIVMPGSWDIVDDDYIIVGGIYRKNGNEVEAEQFEKIVFQDKDRDKEIQKRDDW